MGFLGEAALLCLLVMGANSQEKLSPALLECYEGELYAKWNLLPHTIDTLIGLIRKIEDYPGLNMDMRTLSTALLHRFRQDGIERDPGVRPQEGVTPYAVLGREFFRFQQTLRVIPGNAFNFPNDSLSALERCTLHSMLSSSVNKFERGDEGRVCKVTNYSYRRFWRSADAEGLKPHQMDSRRAKRADPNAMYPAYPPNHPSGARLASVPISRCPIQNGVVQTPWGAVSGGSVLAGIAASLEPQLIRVGDLMKHQVEQRMLEYPPEAHLDNKFIGTLAGDLAEVAVRQGPMQDRFVLGTDGNWNSTSAPRHYFLGANENLEMTAADIRGDLDGLILASQLPAHYSRFSGLRLSQVLDMYYGEHGLFDRSYRACNRRAHYLRVAPAETLVAQTHSAGIVLSPGIATVTLSSEAIEKFAVQAVKELSSVIPTMNSDSSCEHNAANDRAVINEAAVDLTIFLDTTWPFDLIKPIISQLLGRLDMNKFNSNFTIINGLDGSLIVNSSYNTNVFTELNSTYYDSFIKGFDFSRSLKELRTLQTNTLNEEQRIGWGGGKSNVVLFIPNQNRVPQNDKEYCLETLHTISEDVPDAVILFLTYGPKDGWSDYVRNTDTDLFSISISETTESYPFLDELQARIKQVPRRLINSQCGAHYNSMGSSKQVTEYVPSNGANYYRIHPNYFSSSDSENPPKIKIQGSGATALKICISREILHVNVSQDEKNIDCISITGNAYTVTMNCESTTYLHECKPYYFSISANSTSSGMYSCSDSRVCRYPSNVKYTFTYENLVCHSGASTLFVVPILLLLLITRFL